MSVSIERETDLSFIKLVQRALHSPLVDRNLYAAALGGQVQDLGTVERYLQLSEDSRPAISVYFDRQWYSHLNKDVLESDTDSLFHFLKYGLRELRSPHPLIDLNYVDTRDPAYFHGQPNDFALYELLELGLADPSPYFSIAHYETLWQASDRSDHEGPLRHFLTTGLARGAHPHPLLDVFWYAGHYPDAPRDPYEALRHFRARRRY